MLFYMIHTESWKIATILPRLHRRHSRRSTTLWVGIAKVKCVQENSRRPWRQHRPLEGLLHPGSAEGTADRCDNDVYEHFHWKSAVTELRGTHIQGVWLGSWSEYVIDNLDFSAAGRNVHCHVSGWSHWSPCIVDHVHNRHWHRNVYNGDIQLVELYADRSVELQLGAGGEFVSCCFHGIDGTYAVVVCCASWGAAFQGMYGNRQICSGANICYRHTQLINRIRILKHCYKSI